jgi:hypothetical protein
LSYNLLYEKWIPVLWNNGDYSKVGIKEALIQAYQIRQIATPSPLDTFAIYRFLFSLLYWKADMVGGVEQLRKALLTGELPRTVVNGIENEEHPFDLFDEKRPFLQDVTISNVKVMKSVGSLFAEMATGTNITHFHHGSDEDMRLCLPCITLGLLRVVPWTQSGGAGLTPSVHNAPPIMTMAIGDNLAITLGLNIVSLAANAGTPQWSGHFSPSDPNGQIPYLEALTWNPRRIFLPPSRPGTCWYCGNRNVDTVGKIIYMKNDDTKKRSDKRLFEWSDPAAFYAPYDAGKKYDREKNAPYKTIKSSREELAALGRDLPNSSRNCLPAVSVQNSGHKNWLLTLPSTNPANNKTYDHRQVELTGLMPLTMRTPIPEAAVYSRSGIDGWKTPEDKRHEGAECFVQSAIKLLTHTDWVTLSNAAFYDMHHSPAAFDVFSGLYWGLVNKKIKYLPTRNTTWLMLKLMAAVPARTRIFRPDANFRPDLALPKRQINECNRASSYPVSFPRGIRLEADLREALITNLRKRNAELVDWVGLCNSLDQLIK